MQVRVKRLESALVPTEIPLPNYQTADAAGADLCAAVVQPLVLGPGERALVPTGLTLELPRGVEGQVRPRSGLALRHGVTALNSPGTIDADYRGEVGVLLINHGADAFTINRGDRIAQLVIATVTQTKFVPVETLSCTERGEGGFGHTGVNTAG